MALPLKVQKNTASRNLTGVLQKKQCCQAKYLSKSKLETCFFSNLKLSNECKANGIFRSCHIQLFHIFIWKLIFVQLESLSLEDWFSHCVYINNRISVSHNDNKGNTLRSWYWFCLIYLSTFTCNIYERLVIGFEVFSLLQKTTVISLGFFKYWWFSNSRVTSNT